jgi:hypothetical protein
MTPPGRGLSVDPESLVQARFPADAIVHGGEAFYSIATALAVAAFCQEHGLAISGMEGAIIDEDGIRPLLDYIANFSRDPGPTWEDTVRIWDVGACEVLQQWANECPQLLVTMTVMSEEDWRSGLGVQREKAPND